MTEGYERAKSFTSRVDVFDSDIVLIPIHARVHWFLVVIQVQSHQSLALHLYDAKYGNRFQGCLNKIQEFLEIEHVRRKGSRLDIPITKVVESSIPQQTNDNDCGPFLLHIAKCLTFDHAFTFNEKDMPRIRQQLKRELMWKKINTTPIIGSEQSATQVKNRLSRKSLKTSKRVFSNPTSYDCWLISGLQVILRAMDVSDRNEMHSNLGRALLRMKTSACPRSGFTVTEIRQMITSNEQYRHLREDQQCIVELFDSLNRNEWGDVTQMFTFHMKTVSRCAEKTCSQSREQDPLPRMYLDVYLPERVRRNFMGADSMKRLIERFFREKKFCPERIGCGNHQTSGAFVEDSIFTEPEFLLIHIKRLSTKWDEEEEETRYVYRNTECTLPKRLHVPVASGRGSTYSLFAIVIYDGWVDPISGHSNGHYFVQLVYDGSWFEVSDRNIKKISQAQVTKKAIMCCYTKYYA